MQSSTGDGCPVRVYTQPSLCQMTLAAVAESAMTQSTTSSGIREMETEDQFNIEGHKLLAGKFDRHGTIVDMDTCRAIVPTIDPEDRDCWTQQVVDRNKKRCGAKRGHLGHWRPDEFRLGEPWVRGCAPRNQFSLSGSNAESNETGYVQVTHSDTKIMSRIKPTWSGGEMKGKRNSCRGMRWSL